MLDPRLVANKEKVETHNQAQVPNVNFVAPVRAENHLWRPEHLRLNPLGQMPVKPACCGGQLSALSCEASSSHWGSGQGLTGSKVGESDGQVGWLCKIFLSRGYLGRFHVEIAWWALRRVFGQKYLGWRLLEHSIDRRRFH